MDLNNFYTFYRKAIAFFILISSFLFSLYNSYYIFDAFYEQYSGTVILISIVLYLPPNSYFGIILQTLTYGALIKCIDDYLKINWITEYDKIITLSIIIFSLIRIFYVYFTKIHEPVRTTRA